VVEATVGALCASTSRKVDAEIGTSLLLQLISFGIPRIYFWLTFEKRRSSFYAGISVRQVLVIPDVVVVVAFNVGGVLFRLFYLPAGGSLHPAGHLLILELFEVGHLLFENCLILFTLNNVLFRNLRLRYIV
jgi:hypothetical protein